MPEDPHYYTRNIEVEHLVSKARQRANLHERKPPHNRIIKAAAVVSEDGKICMVGGEPTDGGEMGTPAIVIERKGDRISKIVVTCPCGRSSELICEYDDEEEEDSDSAELE